MTLEQKKAPTMNPLRSALALALALTFAAGCTGSTSAPVDHYKPEDHAVRVALRSDRPQAVPTRAHFAHEVRR